MKITNEYSGKNASQAPLFSGYCVPNTGNAWSVNSHYYRNKITPFVMPQLKNIAFKDMRFQQDGATCHIARQTWTVLYEYFLVVTSPVLETRFGQNHLAI